MPLVLQNVDQHGYLYHSQIEKWLTQAFTSRRGPAAARTWAINCFTVDWKSISEKHWAVSIVRMLTSPSGCLHFSERVLHMNVFRGFCDILDAQFCSAVICNVNVQGFQCHLLPVIIAVQKQVNMLFICYHIILYRYYCSSNSRACVRFPYRECIN